MDINVGDYITFKAATRSDYRKVRRKVNGFYGITQMPTVRYHGYSNFVVRLDEIIKVEDDDDGGARSEALWQGRMAGDMSS